jgi:hypothetical protein
MKFVMYLIVLMVMFNCIYIQNASGSSESKSYMVPLLNSVLRDPEFLLLDSDLQRRVILNIYTIVDSDYKEN